jgi:HD-like signal output (HDOD) protein
MSKSIPSLDEQALQKLTPLDRMSPEAVRELAQKAQVRTLKPGSRIFSTRDQDDWTFYVLEGQVRLVFGEHSQEMVAGGTAAAATPLAPALPRKATAEAVTEVSILQLPASLLEVLLHDESTAGYRVEEIAENDERLENRLLYQIFQDYMADRLTVPILPDIALRVRKALEDPNLSIVTLNRIITADPAIAAKLIQVANSAAYRRAVPVENTRDAIARIGVQNTREVVTSIAVKALFHTKSPLVKRWMVELWQHSAQIAAISFVLAKAAPGMNPERALLAGLIHDIGSLLVVTRAAQYPDSLTQPSHLVLAVSKLRGQFGAMILRKWEFPDDMVTVALEAEEWHRDPQSQADYCDLVLIAQLYSFIGTLHGGEAYPPMETLPAFSKLAIDQSDPKSTLQILKDAKESIDEIRRSLG